MGWDYRQHIVRNPKICGGAPVVRGTRVTIRTILASLAEGATASKILADFPSLSEEDVRAVIAFAAVTHVVGAWAAVIRADYSIRQVV